jgi:hypothetical protein
MANLLEYIRSYCSSYCVYAKRGLGSGYPADTQYTVFEPVCECVDAVHGTILGRGRKEDKGLIDTKYDTRRARVWAKLGFTKFWSNCGLGSA